MPDGVSTRIESTDAALAVSAMLKDGARLPQRDDAFALVPVATVERAGGRMVPRDAHLRSYVAGMEAALSDLFQAVVAGDDEPADVTIPTRLRVLYSSRAQRFVDGPQPKAPLAVEGFVNFAGDDFALDCQIVWAHSEVRAWRPRPFKKSSTTTGRSAPRHEQSIMARLSALHDDSVVAHVPFKQWDTRGIGFSDQMTGSAAGVASLRRFFARVAEVNA